MTQIGRLAALMLSAIASHAGPVTAQPADAPPTLAVVHALAWTIAATEPVRDATILIRDDRIVSVLPAGAVPAGVRVIDAHGQPVTPGLVNAATQLGLIEVRAAEETQDQISRDDRDPAFDVSRALNGNSTLVGLARADGLTRALVYPSPTRSPPFAGRPAIARYREDVDILDRARVAVLAVIGGGSWDRVGSRAQQWTMLRRALAEAKRAVAGGAGAARGRGEPARAGEDDMLRPVLTGEVPLAIQTNRETDIRQAIALAGDFGIRVVIVGGSEAWRAAAALASARIAVVLDPQANLPATFDQMGNRQDAAAILARAGVPVAFGLVGGSIHMTYNAGLALREGAGLAVAAGLPYADALRAVTAAPLAIWGGSADRETLTPGADADLVVWDGDPLEPSTNARAVIIAGRTVSTRSRQDLLAERYRDVAR